MISLLFTGDVMLGRTFNRLYENRLYENRPLSFPWGDVLHMMQQSDGVISNLETTLTRSKTKWPDKTFNYKLNPKWAKTLKLAQIKYCSLANNHI